MLVLHLVPPEVVRSAQEQALAAVERPVSRAMAVAIVAIWSAVAGVLGAVGVAVGAHVIVH